MKNKINAVILLLTIGLFTAPAANAAFCSLRDPISAIQMIYEQGYQFRSVVTTVSEQDRQTIKQQLPFTIHQSEVGKHTLYVVYKDDKHAGFLQARSEWAKWGLVEIAWAINVDRSLKGFYFQRCRSPECNDDIQQSIIAVLKNKSLPQLKSLLSTNGEMLSVEGRKAFVIAPQLALLTLRSALKTLVITDISWEKDIEQIAAANY